MSARERYADRLREGSTGFGDLPSDPLDGSDSDSETADDTTSSEDESSESNGESDE